MAAKHTPNKKKARTTPAPSKFQPYRVELTATAEEVYRDIYRRSQEAEAKGDTGNYYCTTYRMLKEAISQIIPSEPLNKRYALSGNLSNIFRLHKGRVRICWVASSAHRTIVVLFISDTLRKEGDVNDPYVIFEKLVKSGKFTEVFNKLGIRIHGLDMLYKKLPPEMMN